ncbi:MAG: glycosyltransferase [Planctomycetota bacterium]
MPRATRFFVGLTEVGHYTHYLARGLRELGFPVTRVVWASGAPSLQGGAGADRCLARSWNPRLRAFRGFREFLRQAFRHDVFIFNYSESFLGPFAVGGRTGVLTYADMRALAGIGKKVMAVVHGPDLRSVPHLVGEMEAAGLGSQARWLASEWAAAPSHAGREADLRRKARRLEAVADIVLARPNAAQFLARPRLLRLPFDPASVSCPERESGRPRVIHAPTNPLVKGTRFVREAVERLRAEGLDFEFEECRNMPHARVLERLETSEIVVDQVLSPNYGFLAIEAMAAGNVVLSGAVPGLFGCPPDSPLVPVSPDTLADRLRGILADRKGRRERGLRGREFVERHHHYRDVALEVAEMAAAPRAIHD